MWLCVVTWRHISLPCMMFTEVLKFAFCWSFGGIFGIISSYPFFGPTLFSPSWEPDDLCFRFFTIIPGLWDSAHFFQSTVYFLDWIFSIFLSSNLWILFSIGSILLWAYPLRVFCLFVCLKFQLWYILATKFPCGSFLCWESLLCHIFPIFHSFQESNCLLKLYWSGSEKEGCLDTAPHLSSAHSPGDGMAEGTW